MAVSSSTNGADTPFSDITHFRSLIGAPQYLAITRPDIQFAVNRVAQRMHQPCEHDYHCLKRILRYIFGTLGRGLLIRPRDLELRGFSDSDWANDKNDRKSTSGFLVFLGPNLISCDDSELQFRKMCIGFGYHERTDDFKVVRIGFIDHVWLNEEYNYEEVGGYDFECRAEIFSLNTKVWKALDLSHDFCYNRVDLFSGVVVNEYMHWKAIKSNTYENKMVILTFHMGDETFQDIECPIFYDGEEINQSIYLGEFRGKLGFLRSYPVKLGQPCYIWTMEEYGEMNSWTCQTIIVPSLPIQYPLAFTKNGQIIIRDKYENIFSYDYNTNQLLDLHIQDDEHAMNFIDYTESLVLVDLNDDPMEESIAEFDEDINMEH
uniref:F-box associated beta-propeller type 1 domain-containing protein n=1 Tax=Solanum lycopersicum TaxID=4081 RepID=A0A3Q7FHB9_SOLLC